MQVKLQRIGYLMVWSPHQEIIDPTIYRPKIMKNYTNQKRIKKYIPSL